jgi:hypothetical protein
MPILTVSTLAWWAYYSAAGGVGAQEFCENTAKFEHVIPRVLFSILDGFLWPATLICNTNHALHQHSRRHNDVMS